MKMLLVDMEVDIAGVVRGRSVHDDQPPLKARHDFEVKMREKEKCTASKAAKRLSRRRLFQ
jgi:hypothetical protein